MKLLNKLKKTSIVFIFFMAMFNIYAAPKSDYEIISGNLKLKVFRRTGNFCLYARSVRGKGKFVPLYDDRMMARCNKFFVYHSEKVYELRKRIGKPVKIELLEDSNSIQIEYNFTDKFYVKQKLSFTDNTYGTSGSLLKIETVVENTDGDVADIGLKALIDTNLGESQKIPLYTDLRTGIFKETVLEPHFEKDSAIISANSDFACMFLINHSDATPIEKVFVANWDRLQISSWEPKVVQGRSFSTRYFHNDSALLFSWPIERKRNNQTLSVSMFIGYYDYLRKNEELANNIDDTNIVSDEEEIEETMPSTEEVLDKAEEPSESVSQEVIPTNELSEEELAKMTEDELKDYRYIQALLNRINEAEKNADNISDEDIEDLTKAAESAIKHIEENE